MQKNSFAIEKQNQSIKNTFIIESIIIILINEHKIHETNGN